ncbi:dna-binding 42 kda [Plasmopara halstedii]|uniref:Dna-binding 42 kDa n=1 Tax=Plasmopara halstedii TaxID=4781 RepID=A0A0P1AXZ3_PLAHL|nr:dna-binding 42 kda [Plasmopara halstedii]CEG47327.1 dna-binding 42 kda [Plasmopara halstedii]|eukprot:XP_024583696.1 dna-binding 42 kda [Plasmopara halstedii]
MPSDDEHSVSDVSDVEEEVQTPAQEVEDCSNSDVVTKYKLAAEIAQSALQGVLSQLVAGADLVKVCEFGDHIVKIRCAAIFKSKKVDKGLAFPTCISVNEILCHFSPLAKESMTVKAGDWVKIDLGCHIDGYIAVVAHTAIVPMEGSAAEAEFPELNGVEADVFKCAHDAVELCSRLIKPGNTNLQVTEALAKLEQSYGVKSLQGTLMHQLKRFVIDGNKMIAQKMDIENRTPKVTFEPNEVYTIDVCYTTGSDKPVTSERRTTVFKRQVDKQYRLKMKTSRYVFKEINSKFPTLPFTIRAFDDESQARMGVVECVKHDLLQAYPILEGRSGDKVAHFKITVLLLPNGTTKITGLDFPSDKVHTDKKVDEETAKILATSLKKKNKKKKKKPAA